MVWVYVDGLPGDDKGFMYVMEYEIDVNELTKVDEMMKYDSWNLINIRI
jgi:hypothetical protein